MHRAIQRAFSRSTAQLERKRFIISDSAKPRILKPQPTTQNDEIREILGLDQSIDREGREILEQFYKKEPVQELSRFNRRVFEKESMPKVTPWITTAPAVEGVADDKMSTASLSTQSDLTPLETLAAHINGLVGEGKSTEALAYLSEVRESDPDSLHPQLYGIIARAQSNAGNTTEAIQILEDMMATLKVLPDELTYNNIIQNLCKDFDYSKATSLLNHMHSHGVTPQETTYEHVVDACASCSTPDVVQTLLQTFQARQVVITIRMINTLLLSMSASHDYQSVIQLYRSLKSTYNLEPNEVTLETALNTFIACNKVNDSVLVLELLLGLNSSLVHEYAFKVFEVCVKGRRYQSAVKLLSEMRKKDSLTDSISELILKYAEEWENALKHLLTTNESTQAALANKYDFESLEPANPRTQLDQESTKSLALHLYKQLLAYKVKLSPTTIALLIRVYHKNNDLVSAVRCWSIHHAHTPIPHPQIIDALLHAIRDLGQEKTARSVLSLRRDESWPLTPKIIQHLLVLMSRYGLEKELIGLVMDMEKVVEVSSEREGRGLGFRVEDYATCLTTLKSFGRNEAAFVAFCEECVPGVVEEYEERIEKIRLRGGERVKVNE